MHSEGYGSCCVCLCVCVCVCVCLSVKSHLTSGASVRPENSATYSPGNEATALPALYGYHAVGHFLLAEYACALLKCYVDRGVKFGQYKTSLNSVSSASFMPLMFTI